MGKTVEVKIEGNTFQALPKTFKTGSRGYHTQGKMELDGKRYQVNILIVEIGSKK